MPRLLHLVVLILFGVSSLAAKSSEDLLYAVYTIPNAIFAAKSDPSKPYEGFIPNPDRATLYKSPNLSSVNGLSGRTYDVRNFFKDQGVTFPEGSEATYDENGFLFLRNTQDNLDLIDSLVTGCIGIGPHNLRTEISVVTLKSSLRPLENPTPSFPELKKLAGDTWKEISRLEMTSKSGEQAISTFIVGKGPESHTRKEGKLQAPEIAETALGSSCALEALTAWNGADITTRISFRHRSTWGESRQPINMRYDGSATAYDGYPQILQIIQPVKDGPVYAIILRSTIALPDTWPAMSKTPSSPGAP